MESVCNWETGRELQGMGGLRQRALTNSLWLFSFCLSHKYGQQCQTNKYKSPCDSRAMPRDISYRSDKALRNKHKICCNPFHKHRKVTEGPCRVGIYWGRILTPGNRRFGCCHRSFFPRLKITQRKSLWNQLLRHQVFGIWNQKMILLAHAWWKQWKD